MSKKENCTYNTFEEFFKNVKFPNKQNIKELFALYDREDEKNQTKTQIDKVFVHQTWNIKLHFLRTFESWKKDSTLKGVYVFRIFTKKDKDFFQEYVTPKELQNNFSIANKKMFQFLSSLDYFKKLKSIKNDNLELIDNKVKQYVNWTGKLGFSEYIDNFENDISYFSQKKTLTTDELSNYVKKLLLKDVSKEKELIKFTELKENLFKIEDELLNKKTLNKIPEEIFELASRDRWRVTKVERCIINRAREIIIKSYTNNIIVRTDYIKEFHDRTFWRIDDNTWKVIITQKEIDNAKYPVNKNIYKLIELEINWKASKTKKFEIETLMRELNWSISDILLTIYMNVLDAVYFFRPDNQIENVEFDTYLISAIKKSLQDLKNQSIKVDQLGWRKERQKDDLIRSKIRRYKFELENEWKDYNLDNLWEKAKFHNDNTTTFKMTKEDVEKIMNNLDVNYLSIDKWLDSWNWEENENWYLLNDLWSNSLEESEYNPVYETHRKELPWVIEDNLRKIIKDTWENIILELWLENFRNDNYEMEIDQEKFNEIYTKNEDRNWKNLEPLEMNLIQEIKLKLLKKLQENEEIFNSILWITLKTRES